MFATKLNHHQLSDTHDVPGRRRRSHRATSPDPCRLHNVDQPADLSGLMSPVVSALHDQILYRPSSSRRCRTSISSSRDVEVPPFRQRDESLVTSTARGPPQPAADDYGMPVCRRSRHGSASTAGLPGWKAESEGDASVARSSVRSSRMQEHRGTDQAGPMPLLPLDLIGPSYRSS